MNLLTSSRLATFQTCPRKHHYRYDVGLLPIGESPRALAFGTAIHAGLEHWWTAHQASAPQYALSAALHAAEDSLTSDDPYTVSMLRALLTAYDARWGAWASTVEVLAVEVPFESALIHPVTGEASATWRLAGKIDAMVGLSDGRVAVVEHKTTSMDAGAGSDYRRALTLNAQVGVYFDGVRALGHIADVCIYDMLRKPQIKPLMATPEESRRIKKNGEPYAGTRLCDETPMEYETRLIESLMNDPDKYLLHAEIVRTDTEMESLRWGLWHTVRAIEEHRAAARVARDVRAVPQHAGACMTHHAPCAFLPVCEGTASAQDTTKYQRVSNPHVELTATNSGNGG